MLFAQGLWPTVMCQSPPLLASLTPPLPAPESGRINLVSNEHAFLGSLSIPVRLWWLPYSMMVGRIVTDEDHLEPSQTVGS